MRPDLERRHGEHLPSNAPAYDTEDCVLASGVRRTEFSRRLSNSRPLSVSRNRSMRLLIRSISALTLAASSACSGAATTPPAPSASSAATARASAIVRIVVPPRSRQTAVRRGPAYISPATRVDRRTTHPRRSERAAGLGRRTDRVRTESDTAFVRLRQFRVVVTHVHGPTAEPRTGHLYGVVRHLRRPARKRYAERQRSLGEPGLSGDASRPGRRTSCRSCSTAFRRRSPSCPDRSRRSSARPAARTRFRSARRPKRRASSARASSRSMPMAISLSVLVHPRSRSLRASRRRSMPRRRPPLRPISTRSAVRAARRARPSRSRRPRRHRPRQRTAEYRRP